jgi:hypothetical protein
MVQPLICKPSHTLDMRLQQQFVFHSKQIGGAFVRTLLMALVSQISVSDSVSLYIGSGHDFVQQLAKLAIAHNLRIFYETGIRNLALA